ncbi:hypothetical protein ABZ714_22225 [Streptomyces sp. NPDC006798]|uniref:nSTAND1 domain-containing NTPase n=1 Tax=Streptomyces sp. NPDC006798 TaxID=3155462 RepID=UPI0033D8DCC6
MGRRELPVDPTAGPVQRFAYELRKLRVEAGGVTYRAMARHVPYSVSTLSRAAAGEQLPSLEVTLAYAGACGGDLREWERRWREAADAIAEELAPEDGTDSPYQGLARFEVGDHERFHGRDELIAKARGLAAGNRFAAVFGPSGSGKSSLLRAGLVPALRAGGENLAAIRILTPGDRPLRTHADALVPKEPGADGNRRGDTLLLVDQFEELFTLCADPAERTAFIDRLVAARDPDSRLRVIIAVRADFYGHCAEHRSLADALTDASLLVGPMTPAELREAIVGPAHGAGLIVEREVTARLVAEVEDEPGGLPLLSHTLRETWRRRRGRTLTTAAYEAAGGLHGAIARTAEHVLADLSDERQRLARLVLLRLITPGDGAPDTRHPVTRAELGFGDPAEITLVVERLARARLLTLDDDTVDLAHEALITAWPRLRTWIDDDRHRLRVHRRLSQAARNWQELGRDSGALYRGIRLTEALEAFPAPGGPAELTPPEEAFLVASQRRRQAATRRTRRLSALLACVLVLALLAAGVALWQRQIARESQQRAVAAQQTAQSRQAAAQSAALMERDPDVASLLAVHAYRASPTAEATAALNTAADHPLRRVIATRPGGRVVVAFSADSRTLATVDEGDGTLQLRDVGTGVVRTMSSGHTAVVASLAFSPDGLALATASDDKSVRLLDLATGKPRVLNGHTDAVTSVAFSPDGRILASGSMDGAARLWDVATGSSRALVPEGARAVASVAFSPDGRTLAVGTGNAVSLWNTATGNVVAADTGSVVSVAFSPDGRTLATADGDGGVRLRDPATSEPRTTLPGAGETFLVAFSPDGNSLVTAGSTDGTAQLRDAGTGELRSTLVGHTDTVVTVAFSPDGRTLATGSDSGVRLWNMVSGEALSGHTSDVVSIAFSPDGRTVATGSRDATARLWDVGTGESRRTLTGHTGEVASVAFSPDGRTLATGSHDRTVKLWDAMTGRLRDTLSGRADGAGAVDFSPDGRTLAFGGRYSAWLWDVATRRLRTSFTGHTDVVVSVAFSPDGRTLASASRDGNVQLWDASTGTTRATLRGPGPTVGSMAFSPDGRTLATTGGGGAVHLRDADTGETYATLTSPVGVVVSVAFSPDGRTLVAGSRDTTSPKWDAVSGALRPSADESVLMAAFSPDGRTLATADRDLTVRLWDLGTRTVRATLPGHAEEEPSLPLAPDDRAATAEDDTTVWLRNVSLPGPDEAIRKICRALRRDLTPAERSSYLPGHHHRPVCP